MQRITYLLLAALLSVIVTGCAMVTPNYSPSVDNAEVLKKSGVAPSAVANITVKAGTAGASSIGIRANTMGSSVGSNYGDYIASAIKQELQLAKLYDPQSTLQISGNLLKNDIAAGGFSTNTGEIEIQLTVKKADVIKYQRVKRVEHSWDSSFVGAVAIPRAQQQYPVMVQKLITTFLNDPEFVTALK
jgi:hypothetical protein